MPQKTFINTETNEFKTVQNVGHLVEEDDGTIHIWKEKSNSEDPDTTLLPKWSPMEEFPKRQGFHNQVPDDEHPHEIYCEECLPTKLAVIDDPEIVNLIQSDAFLYCEACETQFLSK